MAALRLELERDLAGGLQLLMSVRDATFVDTPHIARVYEQAYRDSRYADCTLDLVEAKQMIARAIHRHGQMNVGASLVLVSQRGEPIEGFLIGLLDQVYPCAKELMATDLLFILRPGADPRDARTMLKRLIAWAQANPKVVEVRLGVTDAMGDWRRTAKLYERLGLERSGALFRRGFER